jgi:hypothetical protein
MVALGELEPIWQALTSQANEFWDIELDPLLGGMRR